MVRMCPTGKVVRFFEVPFKGTREKLPFKVLATHCYDGCTHIIGSISHRLLGRCPVASGWADFFFNLTNPSPLQVMHSSKENGSTFFPHKVLRAALALPLILLASCGGGGNGSNGDGSTPSSSTQALCFFDTSSGKCLAQSELNNEIKRWTKYIRDDLNKISGMNWSRDLVNAYEAYAHLAISRGEAAWESAGQGVKIGFVDTGIHTEHPDFAGIGTGSKELFVLDSPDQDKQAKDEHPFSRSHGTAVASAAVGWDSGIAWGATIKMFSSRDTQNPDLIVNLTPHLYQTVLSHDLDILNLSLGPPESAIQESVIQESWTERQVRNNIGDQVINVWAQPSTSEKTILVWAAGDHHCDYDYPHGTCSRDTQANRRKAEFNAHSPHLWAGATRFIPELRGHSIAAVATDKNGSIANFSNRCGIAAEWCIAAPGEDVRVASYEDSRETVSFYSNQSGTSFAAPMVSGGLAVMKQLFRDQLSNTALVSRLFATAKKSGIHADTAIYGQGLMDLGAATNPWGTPAFMKTKGPISDEGTSITSSVISVGSAIGDSLDQALDEEEVAAFDALGAPFWYEFGDFTSSSEGTSLATRLNRFLAPPQQRSALATWKLTFKADALATATGHLALTHGASRLSLAGPYGFSATVFHRSQDDQSPLDALTLSWSPAPLPSLTFEAGYLGEQKSLLGSHGRGAFGQLSGDTLFLSAELVTSTPQGWQLAAQGELGMVNPSVARSQFISDLSSLSTTAFRLEASKPLLNGGTLSVALSQPLRVESGAMTLSLPTGRTREGVVTGKTLSAPLVPTGRQLDLSAQLDLPWLGGDLSLGATLSHQPQHRQSTSPEWTFFTGWRTTW